MLRYYIFLGFNACPCWLWWNTDILCTCIQVFSPCFSVDRHSVLVSFVDRHSVLVLFVDRHSVLVLFVDRHSVLVLFVDRHSVLVLFTCRLWEDGWKDRYYSSKFGVEGADAEFRQTVVNVDIVILPNRILIYCTCSCAQPKKSIRHSNKLCVLYMLHRVDSCSWLVHVMSCTAYIAIFNKMYSHSAG